MLSKLYLILLINAAKISSFRYESGDGSSRQEQGTPNYGKGAPGVEGTGGVAVQGRFAYASPEGNLSQFFATL